VESNSRQDHCLWRKIVLSLLQRNSIFFSCKNIYCTVKRKEKSKDEKESKTNISIMSKFKRATKETSEEDTANKKLKIQVI
jgi:hypothetical protein